MDNWLFTDSDIEWAGEQRAMVAIVAAKQLGIRAFTMRNGDKWEANKRGQWRQTFNAAAGY